MAADDRLRSGVGVRGSGGELEIGGGGGEGGAQAGGGVGRGDGGAGRGEEYGSVVDVI